MSQLHFKTIEECMSYGAKNGQQWVIYDNAIVDVAGFRHPGPQKLISNNLGRDVTKMFDQRGHSEFARELCERMTVGYIGDETVNGQLLNKAYANMSEEEKAIHKRLQDPKVMDITKPLCPQVAKLTNREFIAFVRRPRFMGGNTEGLPLKSSIPPRASRFAIAFSWCQRNRRDLFES